MDEKVDHNMTPKAVLPGEMYDEEQKLPVERTTMRKKGKLVHFDIGLELEVFDAEIDEAELRRVIVGALRYSTASDALTDAVHHRYDDCVLFCGWYLKGSTGPWMDAKEAAAVNTEAARRFVLAAQERVKRTLCSLNSALQALDAAAGEEGD